MSNKIYKCRGWLFIQYIILNKSMKNISKECKTSDTTIGNWIKRFKIPIKDQVKYKFSTKRKNSSKKYKSKKWLRKKYIDENASSRVIAKECNTNKSTILRWLKTYNIPIKNKSSYRKEILHSYGYLLVKKKDHPRSHRGYMYKHILVMENHIKRYLTSHERVHHINEIKDDNRIENLYLCKNQSEHNRLHSQMSSLLAQIYHLKKPCLVNFNKEEGKYYIKKIIEDK